MQNTTRNATLADLTTLLKEQHARKIDIVAPATKIRMHDGNLVVSGAEPILDVDGVTEVNGTYRPTDVCDRGIGDRVSIPRSYWKTMRDSRIDLLDANVNGWLHGRRAKVDFKTGETLRDAVDADSRSFLVRAFRADDNDHGVARAFLSDRYGIVDNIDALTAALDGVRQAGVNVQIDGCDLSESRMFVRVIAPEVQALAPELLKGYRSPFSGQTGDENPTVFAGFVISNSEVGAGAFSIVPRLVVQVCNNGMTIQRDAMRQVHLGARLEEGLVRWTEDTQRKNLELITAKARDAVSTFLDVDYMRTVIDRMTAEAGKPLTKSDDVVRTVCKRLAFSEAVTDSVFAHFISGGQNTVTGVMHAITAAAQEVGDSDTAYDMEAAAMRSLEEAAALV